MSDPGTPERKHTSKTRAMTATAAEPAKAEVPVSLDLTENTWRTAGELLKTTITRLSGDGKPVDVEIEYSVVDGFALFEGDICLGDAAALAEREASRKRGDYAFFISTYGQTWPNGVVPYTSDGPSMARANWLAAYFANLTPIRLVPYTGVEPAWLVFQTGVGNETSVGCQAGAQRVYLAPGSSAGDGIHEVCHALGMWHEHTRPDRDAYINVFYGNIVPSDRPSFQPQPPAAGNYANPYDYNSIMHYPSWASAQPNSYSMLTKANQVLGARNGLSAGDLAGLKALYPTLAWH